MNLRWPVARKPCVIPGIYIRDIILKTVDCQPQPVSIWRRSQPLEPYTSFILDASPNSRWPSKTRDSSQCLNGDRLDWTSNDRCDISNRETRHLKWTDVWRVVCPALLLSRCNKREITLKLSLSANWRSVTCKPVYRGSSLWRESVLCCFRRVCCFWPAEMAIRKIQVDKGILGRWGNQGYRSNAASNPDEKFPRHNAALLSTNNATNLRNVAEFRLSNERKRLASKVE